MTDEELTAFARQIWATCWKEAWPDYKIGSVSDQTLSNIVMRADPVGFLFTGTMLGYCHRKDRQIYLNQEYIEKPAMRDVGRMSCPLETLVHELVHARFVGLEHGFEFDRKVKQALSLIWEEMK